MNQQFLKLRLTVTRPEQNVVTNVLFRPYFLLPEICRKAGMQEKGGRLKCVNHTALR